MSEAKNTSFEECLQKLIVSLEASLYEEATTQLANLHSAEIARLLEAIPPKDRAQLWLNIDTGTQGDILKDLSEEVRTQLLSKMEVDSIVEATESLDMDDLADIVPNLPESALHNLLLTLDHKHRNHLKRVLSYPEDSAGGLMNIDIITVRDDVTVRTVIRYLRLLKEMPIDTDQVFVVDRAYKYLGSIHISTLLTNEAEQNIAPLINKNFHPIVADMPEHEVANLFERRDLISAPVVDKNNQLIGRITIDDVVDVIRDQAEHSVMSMAGLSEEEDVFAPVLQSSKRRSIWLGVNLVTVFVAVFFISLFEATLQEKIALAILMPVVASMGGIAGTQTLILVTRGIATGRITTSNLKVLMNKEVAIGVLNGIVWSLVISAATYIWFADLMLSLVIALAIIVNLIFAAFSGAFLPLLLIRFKIDPALAGGVILTTITDVIGFVAFLGLATLVL
ncbi:Mg/Co/Ni transporter MgtE, CBS domain-containing [Bathymodiolus thermophilus thioautotrophic gill symbiont]|uniref:Magnesium transporter MgtE n=1 Tax=Bathymodiolus thermophilus thioautotrophic gill symbiont TaxID=2360 RepID=A0A1J5UFP9_9GAMM|nr:magnesium transporter [Bathymodiolus thermophilus thioautotrophic gill symbiont]AYQ56613.1 magnesium transporter [Bathymodiolus thermophilus thioautotrophic gill symbiont]OIR24741.1 magnesium transporter [Bathymodiolus thermophilus thioautotrophic gill symbiont]CAB5497843.1 Mg/Co/Ni transporter MgtE, CBS domain-containing [Bathymodiolus thermophilus thioautotrophic gill symbiont]CAB5501700.1 Mg/Co/Ni transporter MgtE, CBS domain-containing [Bathymodiolus thermophilus thioautotrophic gill sym